MEHHNHRSVPDGLLETHRLQPQQPHRFPRRLRLAVDDVLQRLRVGGAQESRLARVVGVLLTWEWRISGGMAPKMVDG